MSAALSAAVPKSSAYLRRDHAGPAPTSVILPAPAIRSAASSAVLHSARRTRPYDCLQPGQDHRLPVPALPVSCGHNGAGKQGVASQLTEQNCYTTGATDQRVTARSIERRIRARRRRHSGCRTPRTAMRADGCGAETPCNGQDGVDATASSFKTEAEMKAADFAGAPRRRLHGRSRASLSGPELGRSPSAALTATLPHQGAAADAHSSPRAARRPITAATGDGATTAALPAGAYAYAGCCAGCETKNGDAFTVSAQEANDGATLSAGDRQILDADASARASLTRRYVRALQLRPYRPRTQLVIQLRKRTAAISSSRTARIPTRPRPRKRAMRMRRAASAPLPAR